MKKTIVTLLFISAGLFAEESTRAEDMKIILEKSYLDSQFEPILNMMAMEAITETDQKMDSEELVEEFKRIFTQEETLAKFAAPYEPVFSDQEVKELRKIHENPVWKKYSQQGMPIIKANLDTMKDTFKELLTQHEEIAEVEPEFEEIADNIAVLQLDQENFHLVKESRKPTIIDINAKWCGPCKMMGPVFDEVSQEYPNIQFAKIDVDSQSELANKYEVTGLPTIVFIKAGQTTPAMRSSGYMSKEEFEQMIEEFLKK